MQMIIMSSTSMLRSSHVLNLPKIVRESAIVKSDAVSLFYLVIKFTEVLHKEDFLRLWEIDYMRVFGDRLDGLPCETVVFVSII